MFSDVLNVFFSFLNNFRKGRSEIGSVSISFSTKGRSQTARMKKWSSSPHQGKHRCNGSEAHETIKVC